MDMSMRRVREKVKEGVRKEVAEVLQQATGGRQWSEFGLKVCGGMSGWEVFVWGEIGRVMEEMQEWVRKYMEGRERWGALEKASEDKKQELREKVEKEAVELVVRVVLEEGGFPQSVEELEEVKRSLRIDVRSVEVMTRGYSSSGLIYDILLKEKIRMSGEV